MSLHIDVIQSTTPRPRPPAGEPLGFGRYFSDHMFTARWSSELGWHQHAVGPYGSLSLDPAAGVFHYGQAIFEGMKVFARQGDDAALFRPADHAQRMAEGAARVCMPSLPAADLVEAAKALSRLDRSWIPEGPNAALYLRPTLVASEPFLGVRPAQRYVLFIIASPVGSYYAQGQKPVKIWVERDQVRAPRGGLGAVKAGANYVASLQAAETAKRAGYDQVLWLDGHDHAALEEVGTMNVFARIRDVLITPPLSDSILSGITRKSVIALAERAGIAVEERAVRLQELTEAQAKGELQELFGTGTAAVVSPIGELALGADQRLVINGGETGEISRWLYEQITGIQRGELPDPFGWMVSINS
jgi:branched-chain amino acid aminotransferase